MMVTHLYILPLDFIIFVHLDINCVVNSIKEFTQHLLLCGFLNYPRQKDVEL